MHSDQDISEEPSRSQYKRDAEALQKLGEQLIALPPQHLAAILLPDKLREAIELARQLTSRGALRRQRQYIGRLMRDLDPAPIRTKLDELRGADRISRARFQQAEHWRKRLLVGGDVALTEFLQRFPQADHAHLQRLVREAAQQATGDTPPSRARELFRYLHELL